MYKYAVNLSVVLTHNNSLLFFFLICSQDEPVMVSLNSSSFYSKGHENILDQGFLLGPSASAIFPSAVPPTPVSSIFITLKGINILINGKVFYIALL